MKVDLSTRNGYDLACGLRGPDYAARLTPEIMYIKWIFPARIRFFAGIEKGCSVREQRAFSRLDADTFEQYVHGAEAIGAHFFAHAGWALVALVEQTTGQANASESTEMSLMIDLAQATLDYLRMKTSFIVCEESLPGLFAVMENAWNKLYEFCKPNAEAQNE